MRRINTIKEADVIQRNPYWIAIVFPFAVRETFDFRTLTSIPATQDVVLRINTPVILTSEIVNFSVMSGYESPMGVLSFNLAASFYEKVDQLGSEDWIVFWALDNKNDFDLLKKELESFSGRPNYSGVFTDFATAPKFVGQISSIASSEFADPNGGIQLTYDIVAYSFPFLNAKQYFDQVLNRLGPEASRWWTQYKGFADQNVGGLISTQLAIQKLLNILIATGPNQGILENRPISPNERFSIPVDLAKMFIPDFPKNQATVLDLFNFWFGIQKYNSIAGEDPTPELLLPDIKQRDDVETYCETKTPLIGEALLGALDFNNTTTYQILQQYLSSPVNEVYCAMRPRPSDRKIVPTVIFRQNPRVLSTNFEFSDLPKVTFFSELPTWTLDPKTVNSKKIGISGASKVNYVQITPVNFAKGERERNVLNAHYALPITDNANILRNGLQSLIQIVPMVWVASTPSATGEPQGQTDPELMKQNSFFNKMMASISFNNHLKLNGTIELHGVQLPMDIGDCCELDGIVFLIEKIQHNGGISMLGQKNFSTILTVTNGVMIDKETSETYFAKMSSVRHSVSSERGRK
jgi:hypothetical protein